MLNVLNMSSKFGRSPSDIMGIEDPYTAYCFDEAALWIMARLEEGEEPVFVNIDKKSYAKSSDFLKKFA